MGAGRIQPSIFESMKRVASVAKKVDGGGRDSLVVEREQGDGLHAKEGCENRLGGSNVDEQKSDQGCEDVGRLANKDYGQTSGLGCSGAEGGSAHVASLTGDQV